MLFSYAILGFALTLAAPFRKSDLHHQEWDLPGPPGDAPARHRTSDTPDRDEEGEPLVSSEHLITGNWRLLPHLLTGGDPAALVARDQVLLSFGTVNEKFIWWQGPGPFFPYPRGADRTRPFVNYLPHGAERLEVVNIEAHSTVTIVGYWVEDKLEENSPTLKYIRIIRSSSGVYLTRALTAQEKQWAEETQEMMRLHR